MNSNAFLAPGNVLGWTAADGLVFVLAAALSLVFVTRRMPPAPPWFLWLADRTWISVTLLLLCPIALRLALLPVAPKPVPSGSDDFGYLFLADTLRHFRLANPPLALSQFFKQLFILQRPVRASMFALGPGFVLLLGWAGTLIVGGALCASLYWMLRGWLPPHWALAGGMLSVALFGPLCYWTNCYWGGGLSATAGCFVFGALPRLRNSQRFRDALLLGLGLSLQAISRQYEFLLLLIAIAFWLRGIGPRQLGIAVLCLVPAFALIAAQNKAVTGSVWRLPYLEYRFQYGVPATFTFQPNPVPHNQLNQEQELDYRTELGVHGNKPESLTLYAQRLWQRLRFYRFFLFAPLYVGLFRAPVRVLGSIAVFVLGSNFYPYFYPHYIAAATCLFLLASLWGLRRLKPGVARAVLLACFVQFCFWYAVHFINAQSVARYESWDYLNGPDPQGRATIENELAHHPGKQVVFVHYSPVHGLSEWVHNDVDLDTSRVIWAHDLGDAENKKLLSSYPGRRAWVLEPDESPPTLTLYVQSASPFEDVR